MSIVADIIKITVLPDGNAYWRRNGKTVAQGRVLATSESAIADALAINRDLDDKDIILSFAEEEGI